MTDASERKPDWREKTAQEAADDRPFPLLRPGPIESLPEAVLVTVGAIVLWIFTTGRLQAAMPIGAAAGGVLLLAGLARMVARREWQRFFLSGQLVLVLSSGAEIPNAAIALSAVRLIAGAIMLLGLLGMARRADELERRVLREALAIAFVLASVAVLAFSFLEGLGVHRAPALAWFEVLVLSLYIGLWLVAHRYRE